MSSHLQENLLKSTIEKMHSLLREFIGILTSIYLSLIVMCYFSRLSQTPVEFFADRLINSSFEFLQICPKDETDRLRHMGSLFSLCTSVVLHVT